MGIALAFTLSTEGSWLRWQFYVGRYFVVGSSSRHFNFPLQAVPFPVVATFSQDNERLLGVALTSDFLLLKVQFCIVYQYSKFQTCSVEMRECFRNLFVVELVYPSTFPIDLK